MTKILLIEDDQFKSDAIINLTKRHAPTATICLCKDVTSAVNALKDKEYDLILLDMALPSHALTKGQSPLSLLSGGLEILFELKYQGRPDPVAVVTQYPEIELDGKLHAIGDFKAKLKAKYGVQILNCVAFDHEGDEWKSELIKILGKLV